MPLTFNLLRIRQTKRPKDAKKCQICEIGFSKTRVLGKVEHHCKRCGKAICDDCSSAKRVLCRQDSVKYRVCDICDTDMDNHRLKKLYEDAEEHEHMEIERLNEAILDFDDQETEL